MCYRVLELSEDKYVEKFYGFIVVAFIQKGLASWSLGTCTD